MGGGRRTCLPELRLKGATENAPSLSDFCCSLVYKFSFPFPPPASSHSLSFLRPPLPNNLEGPRGEKGEKDEVGCLITNTNNDKRKDLWPLRSAPPPSTSGLTYAPSLSFSAGHPNAFAWLHIASNLQSAREERKGTAALTKPEGIFMTTWAGRSEKLEPPSFPPSSALFIPLLPLPHPPSLRFIAQLVSTPHLRRGPPRHSVGGEGISELVRRLGNPRRLRWEAKGNSGGGGGRKEAECPHNTSSPSVRPFFDYQLLDRSGYRMETGRRKKGESVGFNGQKRIPFTF